mgnify:CR=1 FL=1
MNSDMVEANIRTDTGGLAPFVDGKVLMTLPLADDMSHQARRVMGLGTFLEQQSLP